MPANEKIKLLLIDDEEKICKSVQDILKDEGFEIDYRTSGEKGIEYLERNKGTDLVLLDINLGSGMNGIEALKLIKKRFKGIEVIILTGEERSLVAVECMRNGAFDFMNKPFDKEHFLNYAKAAVERKKYLELTEKDRNVMIQAMAFGVGHLFGNKVNSLYLNQEALAKDLKNTKDMVQTKCGFDQQIADSFSGVEELINILGKNIENTRAIIETVRGYNKTISENESYGLLYIEDITNIAAGMIMLNNKLDESPVKLDIKDKCFYGIKSMVLETVYGCLQNAYEAVQYKKNYHKEYFKEGEAAGITLSYSETAISYVIEIKDNGIGIKEDDKKKIYVPYFTTKVSSEPGMGARLFVMKKMIEEHHKGRLTVDSEYSKGTTVKIEIPKESKIKAVLVIDDEKAAVDSMVRIFSRRGYTAVGGTTGKEGLEKYKELRPICVFLDMTLKYNEKGEDVLKAILQIDPNAYVYFVTGNEGVDDVMVKQLGAKGVILKPALIEDMLDIIKTADKERTSRA